MTKTVIVYSMQKAGSTTVMRALESAGYHAHRGYAENIHTLPWRECPIVTLVRDPFEHAISLAFEKNLMQGEPIPDKWHLGHFPALTWFDEHFEPLFGINPVDDFAFIENEPLTTYIYWQEINNLPILFVRTDKLSKYLCSGLRRMLDTTAGFDVQHRARGADRFGHSYRVFLDHIELDGRLTSDIIESDYCKAFFTDEERDTMNLRWNPHARR